MNTENIGFLLNSLKYLGFQDKPGICDRLEEEIANEPLEFQLTTEAFFEETCKMETILYFVRSDRSDLYFFSRYEAWLHYPDDPEKDRKQTFFISKGRGVTFKEAFNLLQGRAVNKNLTSKEGEKYNAWLQLNFEEKDTNNNYKVKQFHEHYGYELEKVLEKYPIRELDLPQLRQSLLRSLKRGNLHAVTLKKARKIERMLIEASPQYKSINLYRPDIKAGYAYVESHEMEPEPELELEEIPPGAYGGEVRGNKGNDLPWDDEAPAKPRELNAALAVKEPVTLPPPEKAAAKKGSRK